MKIKPNKRLTILALWAARLHSQGICQMNHTLEYHRGWFYLDRNPPFQNCELVREAEDRIKAGFTGVVRRHGMHDVYFLTECRTEAKKRHRFTVCIEGCTAEQALQVLRERLGHDEDYGFPYTIQF